MVLYHHISGVVDVDADECGKNPPWGVNHDLPQGPPSLFGWPLQFIGEILQLCPVDKS